jgi:hypothetical protein
MVLYEIYQVLLVLDVKTHALKKLVQETLTVLTRFDLNLVSPISEVVSLGAILNGRYCHNMTADTRHSGDFNESLTVFICKHFDGLLNLLVSAN